MGEMDAEARAEVMSRARWKARQNAPETGIGASTRILAIGSGKGGVGKSSVTVNLAVSLAARGLTVGVLDADIWGFSVPRLLGMQGGVEARKGKMIPLERPIGPGLLKVLSMGFLRGAEEDEAIMWRGLILNRAVQQFLQDAEWGDLDYLLVDLPPGTGDVQMGLARMLPRTELEIVTTPPVAAQKVASRAADMARRGYLRVAGVIENMSDFTCEHGTNYRLFGAGGGDPAGRGHRGAAHRKRAHPPRDRGRGRRRHARSRLEDGRAGRHLRGAGPGGRRRGGTGHRDLRVHRPPARPDRRGGRRRAGLRPRQPARRPSAGRSPQTLASSSAGRTRSRREAPLCPSAASFWRCAHSDCRAHGTSASARSG